MIKDFLEKFENDSSFRNIDELWKIAGQNNYHRSAMTFGRLCLDLRIQSKQKILPTSADLLQQLSISGFYTGDSKDRSLGHWATEELSLNKEISSKIRNLSRKNLIYYTKKIQSQKQIQLLYNDIDWNVTNPSILRWKNNFWLIQRSVNYTIDHEGRYNTGPKDPIITKNYLVQLDDQYNIIDKFFIGNPKKWPKPNWNLVLGFEDCRLFMINNEIWCSATVRERHPEGLCQMVLMKINLTAKKCYFEEPIFLPSPAPEKHQKNWMPFAESVEPRFIYCCDPVLIIDDKNSVFSKQKTSIAGESFRGGSQIIKFNNGYLTVIHESIDLDNGLRDYSHRFIYLNDQYQIESISSRFKLNGERIEFVAGITQRIDNKDIILSYGVNDSQSWLAIFSEATIKSVLRNVL